MKKLLFFTLVLPSVLFAQHTLKGVFRPAENYKYVLLYKLTPGVSKYIGNKDLKKDGSFEIKLDSSVVKGVYRIVYNTPQEDYNFDVIYNGKEDIDLVFDSETGVTFLSSSENQLLSSYTSSMSAITNHITEFYSSKSKRTRILKSIYKTQRETQSDFEDKAKNTIVKEFIKANRPYIPEEVEDAKTYSNNLKKHYFDYVDFKNKTLQSSSFLQEKMLNYVFGLTVDSLDEKSNYQRNINVLYTHLKEAPKKTQRILLFDLWQQMSDLGHEAVANYITDNYLKAIAKSLGDRKLVNALVLYKNLSHGSVAPDFDIEVKKEKEIITTRLRALEASKNYIIVFWNSSCGHCLKEIPKLHEYVKTFAKDKLKVIAVALENEPYKWKDLTYRYTEFIHVYGEGKWDNKIGDDYGVKATPTYFILDKDKKIVNKPKGLKSVKAFFNEKE